MGTGKDVACFDLANATEKELHDVNFLKKAIESNYRNIKYVPSDMLKKLELVFSKDKQKRLCKLIKTALKIKEECAMTLRKILSNDSEALKNAGKYAKNNRKIVFKAIETFGADQLANAGEQLRVDEQFVLSVVKVYPNAIVYADALLLISPSFLKKAYLANDEIGNYLPGPLKRVLDQILDGREVDFDTFCDENE